MRRRVQKKTWPYGTKRKATVMEVKGFALFVEDDEKECHVLLGTGHDKSLKPGDVGVITFVLGAVTGGHWRFEKDARHGG